MTWEAARRVGAIALKLLHPRSVCSSASGNSRRSDRAVSMGSANRRRSDGNAWQVAGAALSEGAPVEGGGRTVGGDPEDGDREGEGGPAKNEAARDEFLRPTG